MDIAIAEKIQDKIAEIEIIRKSIRERGAGNAQAIADYDKAVALALIGLKNGETYELDGKTIKNPPATICEKVARGICWKEKLEQEKADALYKSAITNLNAVMAELNAYQTLNRYLDRV